MWAFLLKTELDLVLKYPIEIIGAGFMSFGFLQTYFLVCEWIEKEYRNEGKAKFRIVILILLLVVLWSLAMEKIFAKYVVYNS
jgi:hypothetical protein